MVVHLRKDSELRQRWKTDREAVCKEFGLSPTEIDALMGDPNPRVLMDLGVHQYLIPHILRLTYGESGMTSNILDTQPRRFAQASTQEHDSFRISRFHETRILSIGGGAMVRISHQ